VYTRPKENIERRIAIMNEALYCGLDIHKRFSYIVVKDGAGQQVISGKVRNNAEELSEFFEPCKERRIKVALEATSNYYWMYETLDRMNFEVNLSHPLKTRMIAEARIKSDKIDAGILSDLLRGELLPTSYIPDQKTRELREILRHRMRLVSHRSRLKNNLRTVLTKNNCSDEYADITGIKARKYIDHLSLRPVFRLQCNDVLDQIELINKQINAVNKQLKEYVKTLLSAQRLTDIEWVGIFSALVLVAEIGDVNRFATFKKLVRYAGLCPGLHQAGNTYYHRSIVKDGNKYLRWILCEVAHHAVRNPGPLKDFYSQLWLVKGKPKALIAVSRKILTGIYFMLKDGTAFNPVRRKKHTHYKIHLDKLVSTTGCPS